MSFLYTISVFWVISCKKDDLFLKFYIWHAIPLGWFEVSLPRTRSEGFVTLSSLACSADGFNGDICRSSVRLSFSMRKMWGVGTVREGRVRRGAEGAGKKEKIVRDVKWVSSHQTLAGEESVSKPEYRLRGRLVLIRRQNI